MSANLTAAERAALLELHDWDELIFGGFYCLHCTPDDEDSLDDPIAWPCPPLREAGVTDEEARALILAHREQVAAKYQAEKEAKQAELQRRADEFNARYPVGTPVVAYPGCRPENDRNARRLVTRTRSKASVLSGHTDVVWVDGHSACIALSHVDPVSESVFKAAREAETAAAVAELGALPMPAGLTPLDPSYEASLKAIASAHSDDPETAVYRQHIGALLTEIRRQREELAALTARLAEVVPAPFSLDGADETEVGR